MTAGIFATLLLEMQLQDGTGRRKPSVKIVNNPPNLKWRSAVIPIVHRDTVSHDQRIKDVADRILWLEDGQFKDRAVFPASSINFSESLPWV